MYAPDATTFSIAQGVAAAVHPTRHEQLAVTQRGQILDGKAKRAARKQLQRLERQRRNRQRARNWTPQGLHGRRLDWIDDCVYDMRERPRSLTDPPIAYFTCGRTVKAP